MGDKTQFKKAAKDAMKLIGWIVLYALLYAITPEAKPPTCAIIYFGHGSRYGGVQAFVNPDTFRALVKFGYWNHTNGRGMAGYAQHGSNTEVTRK